MKPAISDRHLWTHLVEQMKGFSGHHSNGTGKHLGSPYIDVLLMKCGSQNEMI